ncbi:MAG: NADH-quinone oxidoreductase subunit NuoE family protein [Candidatus Heimdallarchaeaceae archaeon]
MDKKISIINILHKHSFSPDALIQILSEIQEVNGYLPPEVLRSLSKELSIPLSKIWGVITFYSFFKLEPPAEIHISVCQGTACHVAGAKRNAEYVKSRLKINFGEHTEDNRFSLESVACIGACGLSPTITVNGKTYGRKTVKTLKKLLNKLGAPKDE